MATPSLIQTLNANASRSPDEIVKVLGNKGWIAFKTMTQDQYQFLVGKVCVVVADNGDRNRNGGFWRITSLNEDWVYPQSWDPSTPLRLQEFWFKLLEEWTEDDLPDPSLGRHAGQDPG